MRLPLAALPAPWGPARLPQARRGRGPSRGLPPPPTFPTGAGACRPALCLRRSAPALSPATTPARPSFPSRPGPAGQGKRGKVTASPAPRRNPAGAALRQSRNGRDEPPAGCAKGRGGAGRGRTPLVAWSTRKEGLVA